MKTYIPKIKNCVIVGLTLIILLFMSGYALADTVYMISGEIIKGLVVEEHHDRIILSTYKGEVQIPKFSIEQIFFDKEEQNYMYLGDKELDSGNLELALTFYQKASQINPDSDRLKGAFFRLIDITERKKLSLEPADFPDELKLQLGITIIQTRDKIKVESVKKRSSAEKSGVTVGDFITGVWDYSVMYMDAGSAAEMMVGAPRSPVKLNIEKDISMPVKRLPWYMKIFNTSQMKDFGFDVSLKPAGLVVRFVDYASPAEKAGLKSGDIIIRINGESTRYMPLQLARRKILSGALKNVFLTIKRQAVLTRS